MKFAVLALDYDGTIAERDELHPEVRAAIAELRRAGIVVILVTGRILSDLRRVAGDLRFLDAVVAENGCVLSFPSGGRRMVLGPPPPRVFLDELRRRGLDVGVGDCIVEADAAKGTEILALVRAMELPLVLLFNRGRVMVLPQGISKATGLHAALRLFRLSEHNTLGIGDAENDHALLQSCEVGLAVEWGSPILRALADDVVHGDGPAAVAPYIRAAARSWSLPYERSGRRGLLLGHGDDGRPLTLAVPGRNVLITGDSHSGKSWVAGQLCEQLVLQRYSVCVIDPEGDHRGLEALPGVVALGGESVPPRVHEIALAVRHPDLSVVVDLSRVEWEPKRRYVQALLPQLVTLRRRTGLPHRIVVDEAHEFLRGPSAGLLLDPELDGYTLITYRLATLDPEVRRAATAIVATRSTNSDEVRLLTELSHRQGELTEWSAELCQLSIGEAALLPGTEEAHGSLRRFYLEPRMSRHVRHREKYVDVPVGDHRAFVFTQDGRPTGQRAHTLRELTMCLSQAPPDVLAGHLRRGDIARWVREVFADQLLAADLQTLELLTPYEALSDIRAGMVDLITQRYSFAEESERASPLAS